MIIGSRSEGHGSGSMYQNNSSVLLNTHNKWLCYSLLLVFYVQVAAYSCQLEEVKEVNGVLVLRGLKSHMMSGASLQSTNS